MCCIWDRVVPSQAGFLGGFFQGGPKKIYGLGFSIATNTVPQLQGHHDFG